MLVVTGEVEDVVNHLEGQTQLAAEAVELIELGGGQGREHPGGPGTVGDQGGGFAVALLEVGLEALAGVVAEQALLHFAVGQVHDHPAEQLHHLEVIEVGQVPAGLGKEKIPSQHRHPVVEAAVHGVHPTAGGGPVHHVVVHQRGRVDHFGDLGQAPVARAQLAIAGHSPGEQQHDAGAEALATGRKKVFGGGLEDGVTGPDQAAQIGQQGIQVSLNGLEQLCNRCHNTSAVN